MPRFRIFGGASDKPDKSVLKQNLKKTIQIVKMDNFFSYIFPSTTLYHADDVIFCSSSNFYICTLFREEGLADTKSSTKKKRKRKEEDDDLDGEITPKRIKIKREKDPAVDAKTIFVGNLPVNYDTKVGCPSNASTWTVWGLVVKVLTSFSANHFFPKASNNCH
jgi:hypothetical protein